MHITPGQVAAELPALVMRHAVSPVARIVVGVNGSAGSAAALRWAVAEACRRQALLRIVSAWEESEQPGAAHSDDPAQIAAARVQKALARVLLQQHYPRRIACVTPMGIPGEALLNEASDVSLLVLGAAGVSVARAPGRTGRYCLRRGTGPLVFVPARPAP
jgi:nucleotide-binding universal stress UspA family protein